MTGGSRLSLFKRIIAFALLLSLLWIPVYATDELPTLTEYPEGTLEAAFAALAEETAPDYTIVCMGYKNTVTGEEHYYNPDIHMVAASLYKTPLNMIYSERIAKGEMSYDQTFDGRTYREIQSLSLTYSDNPTSVSLLMDIGDWYGLRKNAAEYLGEDSEDEDYLRRSNRFTVREMVHCMDLLQTESERFPGMLDCLLLSAPGKFFKVGDPDYEIAQKYGNLNEGGTFLHAAGIIYTEEPIAVCVMTYGPTDSTALFSGFVELVTQYTEEDIAERKAEEARLEEEARLAEEQRLAEEKAQKEAERAEEVRLAEEKAQEEEQQQQQAQKRASLVTLAVFAAVLILAIALIATKKTSALLALVLVVCLALTLLSLQGESSVSKGSGSILRSVETALERFRTDSLSGLQSAELIRVSYEVDEDAVQGPEPDASCYGEAQSYEEFLPVLSKCRTLLGADSLLLTETTVLKAGSSIRYYADDTILAVVWQERCTNQLGQVVTATYAEVKIADGSQLRRKLGDDSYGSSIQKFPTELASEANAVLALNGDFYRFQNTGIHVYNRTVYASDGEKTDACFFDSEGNLLFVPMGTLSGKEEVESYVAENDVLFGVSFGPILIQDGQDVTPEYYWMGQSRDNYPRCALCQLGERHYLAATFHEGASVREVTDWLLEKGIENAYAMDGGQSAVIILGGELCNPMEQYSGSQRTMSDIIYFCTAMSAEDRR